MVRHLQQRVRSGHRFPFLHQLDRPGGWELEVNLFARNTVRLELNRVWRGDSWDVVEVHIPALANKWIVAASVSVQNVYCFHSHALQVLIC